MQSIRLLVISLLLACAMNPSPRVVISAPRPLTRAEIAHVLGASRQALAGRTLRLPPLSGGDGAEILMGGNGRPKIERSVSAVVGAIVPGMTPPGSPGPAATEVHMETVVMEHTGRPARHCDGSVEPGEMLADYRLDGSTWRATARPQRPAGYGTGAVFAMLQDSADVTSGERGNILGRSARAFVSPWRPAPDPHAQPPLLAGDPAPNVRGEPPPGEDAVQTLWIDMDSLLPLRWERSKRGSRLEGYDFRYETIDVRTPAGVSRPACIP